jgi:formylglycine-generating enzyme required for sulfatase activity
MRPLQWLRSRRACLAAALILALPLLVHGAGVTAQPSPASSIGSPLSAEQERALEPKDTFQECSGCPVMMVVSAGSFVMGSPASEPDRKDYEGPQHAVTIARQFAVGQFALTYEEWNACFDDGGCSNGQSRDQDVRRLPVESVSWDDANAYLAWLTKKTGKPYRLLSEAEYEYAARAGTQTAYPWGNAVGNNNARCNGCDSRREGEHTAPVGSFAANGFGLYDMVGNVWEWTQDCYHDSYEKAPTDGSDWTGVDCSLRVIRGGSWDAGPMYLRSASRQGITHSVRGGYWWGPAGTVPGYETIYFSFPSGFRVARTLLAR